MKSFNIVSSDEWIEDGSILVKQYKEPTPNSKIAAFDLVCI